MVKTLTARTRVFFSSIFETMWAIGVSSVVGHLSTYIHSHIQVGQVAASVLGRKNAAHFYAPYRGVKVP